MPNVGAENQPVYTTPLTQVASVGTSSAQLPATGGGLVMLHSASGNTGTITVSSVNPAVAGVGWTLGPGESTPWLPVNSLAAFWAIATVAAQSLEILELK